MDATHELLISRLIDDPSSAEAWQDFESAAASTPTLWRDLAEAQRCQAALSDVVNSATAVAQYVDAQPDHPGVIGRIGSWSGWAVAAIVTFVLFWSIGSPTAPAPLGGEMEVNTAGWTADQFRDMYLQRGQESGEVLRELPTKVMLEATPIQNGDGFTVVFIRGIVERRQVPDLYEYTPRGEDSNVTRVRYPSQPY